MLYRNGSLFAKLHYWFLFLTLDFECIDDTMMLFYWFINFTRFVFYCISQLIVVFSLHCLHRLYFAILEITLIAAFFRYC